MRKASIFSPQDQRPKLLALPYCRMTKRRQCSTQNSQKHKYIQTESKTLIIGLKRTQIKSIYRMPETTLLGKPFPHNDNYTQMIE